MGDTQTLARGAKGETVRYLQECLVDAGFDVGPSGADADFGRGTETAVKSFQVANGLDDNGVVEDDTWEALVQQSSTDSEMDFVPEDVGGPRVTELVWIQMLGDGDYRFNFEGAPAPEYANEYFWPDGTPEGVDVTLEGIDAYRITGLTDSARREMRDDIGKWVLSVTLFADDNTEREAEEDWEERTQAAEAALDEVHAEIGMTWRELRDLGTGWFEVNGHFVWQGYQGTDLQVQTYPYFHDETLNGDMRYWLESGNSVSSALDSIEEQWRQLNKMMIIAFATAGRGKGIWKLSRVAVD